MKPAGAPWFTDLYNRPAYLRLYEAMDRNLAPGEAAAAVRFLGLRPGARVLDLACGFGRHVVELQRLGYRAVGVDLAKMMVERAATFAQQNRLPPHYVRADFRALPFHGTFDAATSFFVSFGFLGDSENLLVMREFTRVLRPGGRLFMDTWNAPRTIAELQPRITERRADAVVIERSRFNAETRRVEWWNSVRFHDGSREKWSQSVRLYSAGELRALMRRAGFRSVQVFGDWDGSKWTRKSPRVILVAKN